jgi:hypothetical protein
MTYPSNSLKNLKKCQMDKTKINSILEVTWTGFVTKTYEADHDLSSQRKLHIQNC